MDEIRIDTGKIFKSEKTPEGYLRVWMTVSRVGDLVYRNDDGSERIEYVSDRTLFDSESLNTAWGKPITDDHPRIDDRYQLIDANNTRNFERGMTQQSMVVNDKFLTVVGVISDADLIKKVESGTTQVSAGYKASVVNRGDGKFEQTNRRYNHFAIVPKGRAGGDVKVHLDCFRCDAIDNFIENDVQMTVTVHLDGIGYQVEPNIASAIAQSQAKFDNQLESLKGEKISLESQLADIQTKLDKATGELEATKTKLDEAVKLDFSGEISARMDVWAEVLPTIKNKDSDFRCDYALSIADIKRTYLSKCCDRTDLANKSDAYVDGLYEALKPDERTDAITKCNDIFDSLSNLGKKPSKDNIAQKRQSRELPTAYQGGKM
jgi:hypothetical protein